MTQCVPFPITKKLALSLIVPAMMMANSPAVAQETPDGDVVLDTLFVTLAGKKKEKIGETVLTRKELNEQLTQNSHDLVRYNTEVDVAEVGRYGNKGFAIRGVDGNRVNMNVDGVALPEAEANEIFSPYGYMYEGRFNPDVEMMDSIRIHAGADSLTSGSGAIGGSVSYRTKQPTDLIKSDKDWGGYVKTGYTKKNEEWLNAVGLAIATNKIEAMVNYAHREGHETKNHDMHKADKSRLNTNYIFPIEQMPYMAPNGDTLSLIYPDPLKYKRDSVIGKVFVYFGDGHRLGIHGMYQKQDNLMNTDSKNATTGSRLGNQIRRAHDQEEMKSYGASYRYQPSDDDWIDNTKLTYTHNAVLGLADTWMYDRDWNKDTDWNKTDIKSVILSNQEYRPTKTRTDQVSFNLKAQPWQLGLLGEHHVSIYTNHIKQNYTNEALVLYPDGTNFVSYAFADAKKNVYNFSFVDDIQINDRLTATLGIRYENYKYSPYFQNLDEARKNAETCTNTLVNDWLSTSSYCQSYRNEAGLTAVFTDESTRQAWIGGNSTKYTGLKTSKFNHMTWGAGLDAELVADKLNARYKIGTGFLAPTITQIYSNATFNAVTQVPNYHLKPEASLNQELELEFKPTNNISLTTSGYLTRYKDFIHTKYSQGTQDNKDGCTRGTCLQSINLDDAEVKGVKLGLNADFSDQLDTNGKFNVFANYHFAKDKAFINTDKDGKLQINTLAAVPTSLLIGSSYTSADDRWQLNVRANIIKRKKAKNTKTIGTRENYIESKEYCNDTHYAGYCEYANWDGYDEVAGDYYRTSRKSHGYTEFVDTYATTALSKNALIIDVYGSKKFGKNKNVILNAGAYNITNQKYIPWETLRQFANTNINSMVDKGGYGFNRYTAPGRYYALSLTYEF